MSRSNKIAMVIVGVAILALVSTLVLTNMNSGSNTESNMMGRDGSFNSVAADMGMEHIHNLMLTDSSLLIGTHEGLWSQVPGHAASRVGSSHFDVMGLTMMNGEIVASGHPGAGEESVNNLGFRTSTNGGMNWTNTSLFGKVDFHRLVTSKDSIMGISAQDGGLMRSDDAGRTWTTRTNPGIYDLAMDPTNSKMVIGTTQNGPMMSIDGGKTFATIPNVPLIALLSWDKARLVGVTPAGDVYQSLDMGTTWKKISTVTGEPMAISVKGNQIAILAGTTVYFSTNAGVTFSERITGVGGH
jgi:photosystem II stability/assembly factor-like uncharacterized protein